MKQKTIQNKPFISVIITSYNAGRFIEEAIQSILTQTYKNFEIIIVDDGSTDGTYNTIKQLGLKDKRIKAFRIRHSGPSKASNLALRLAKGEFIARMDADDIACPDRLQKQVDFLLKHKDVVIVGGQCVLIDEVGKEIGEKRYPYSNKAIYNALFVMNPIQHPTCMIRRSLLPKNTISYHNHFLLAHDLEFIFEIAQYGKLANLPHVVLHYRQHANSLSLKNPKETFRATVRVRNKSVKNYGYKPTLYGKLMHYYQIVLVTILPNRVIYSLFQFLRFRKKIHISQKVLTPLQQYFYKVTYRLSSIAL